MRRLLNKIYFARKHGACVDSATVGRRCKLGAGTHVKAQAVLRRANLGQRCYVNRGAEIYETDMGPFCSVGQMAQIGPNEHLTDEMTTCNALYGPVLDAKLAERNAQPTTVGADVWIGSRAVILRGTRVGTGVIIAAGAVVTKDVPDYAIVAGLPGRVIRKRFSDPVVTQLLDSEWWTRPPGQIQRAVETAAAETDADTKAKRFLDALGRA